MTYINMSKRDLPCQTTHSKFSTVFLKFTEDDYVIVCFEHLLYCTENFKMVHITDN